MDSKHTIELIGSTFELAEVAILVIGSVLAFARYIVSLIRFRDGLWLIVVCVCTWGDRSCSDWNSWSLPTS